MTTGQLTPDGHLIRDISLIMLLPYNPFLTALQTAKQFNTVLLQVIVSRHTVHSNEAKKGDASLDGA